MLQCLSQLFTQPPSTPPAHRQLKILMYNVSFLTPQPTPTQTLINLLMLETPDIICLQDITSGVFSVLQNDDWVRTYDVCRKGFITGVSWYGNVTLVCRKRLRLIEEMRVEFRQSVQSRNLLVVDVEGKDGTIPRTRISQSHFETLHSIQLRQHQYETSSLHTRVTPTTPHRFSILCSDVDAADAFEKGGFRDLAWRGDQGRFWVGWSGDGMRGVEGYGVGERELEEGSSYFGVVGVFGMPDAADM